MSNTNIPSALDLIKSNFDFVQNQYREDYEKQPLIGYDAALEIIDKFVAKQTNANQNFPLIVTGDEGCGKTHLMIHWLYRFNN